ncbi:Alpha/Beta hydrolase protein [Clohesyomyces aquaticus]|uniref:Alpha/Beta hydrolase protein n=1 Tax=Clohesyomyces aquaticus TaxID=1231657 RepID=A0A1Y1Y7S8_9PLEO|nr:Alpha/Beta hydrolase protein [Clohesyomyces aquaticus]
MVGVSTRFALALLALPLLCALTSASSPNGSHSIDSKVAPGASISYKQTSICETTPGVRGFSGYVHLPSSLTSSFGGLAEYNASIFFWYFESRNNPKTSPLSLYLGGGPGATSMTGVTNENGPCTVNPNSNSTTLNPWSWNNNVNMLYIDQPVQVGFSYDELVPSILDLLTGKIKANNGSQTSNTTTVAGILPSQNPQAAVNTTTNSAKMLWQFAQVWLQEFPEYETSDDRISIWANSYGGHWGPGSMAHFQTQNSKIQNGTLDGIRAKHLNLDTLGLTNACIDSRIEAPFYPEMAFNNTYGFQAIPENIYQEARNNMTKKGGCMDLLDQCRALGKVSDPDNVGNNDTVNAACGLATGYCFEFVQGAYTAVSGRSAFDMSRNPISSVPHEYITGFLNQEWVQQDLGVPLNFSAGAPHIVNTFFGVTGDPFKVTIESINQVAQGGVKVALVFGDRDYRCNWLGGEAISLAMTYSSAPSFRAAGYESITTNSTYAGGVVRQHNKVSFSRVFEAGHAVGAFQPETVSKIFDRAMLNKDVATGSKCTAGNKSYSSTGPASSFGIKNVLPPMPENECYMWDTVFTCTPEEIQAFANGTAGFEDFVLVSK